MSVPSIDPQEPPPGREPVFNIPAIVVAFIALCAGLHFFRMAVLSPEADMSLLLRFAFWPIRYSGGYDLDVYAFVSPVSYSLLHGDLLHLAVNMVWLAAFGSPLARRLGVPRFILFWIVTSLGAVALHFAVYPNGIAPLVGASGAISGMMGAAARFGFRIDRREGRGRFNGPVLPIPVVLTMRPVVVFLVVWMIINVVTGLGFATPGVQGQIAWEAHVGGFLIGFLGLRLFDRRIMSELA